MNRTFNTNGNTHKDRNYITNNNSDDRSFARCMRQQSVNCALTAGWQHITNVQGTRNACVKTS